MRTLMNLFTQTDKLQHFIIGTYLYMLTSIDFGFAWPWLIVAVAAFGKEIVDRYVFKKKFSWQDIFMNMFGVLCIFLLLGYHYLKFA